MLRPGRLELNRDIWASRRQRSGFRDRVSQTGTVPEKLGRLVSLKEPHIRWDLDPPQERGLLTW